MPEFVARYTPKNAYGFAKGYFEAMEWLCFDLSPDNESPFKGEVKGFSEEAVAKILSECRAFEEENEELLATYGGEYKPYRSWGISEESAGNDFFLSRNGHGAGFWDRGNHACFRDLHKAAKAFRGQEAYIGDDGFLHV